MSTIARQPRMVASSTGLTSSGKTYFALKGTPRPVLLLDQDFGAECLPEEILDGVIPKQYDVLAGAFKGESDQARAQLIVREVERLLADYREAIESGAYRTIVFDTASVLWSGLRLRHKSFEEAQTVLESIIRAAYKSPTTNVIFLHHMQTVWAKNSEGKSYKKHGVYEQVGWEGINSKVQLAIEQRWVPANEMMGVAGHFEATILKCRDNKLLEGEVIEAPDWVTLCSVVAPSVDWSA